MEVAHFAVQHLAHEEAVGQAHAAELGQVGDVPDGLEQLVLLEDRDRH
jgi:hypothetical protein